MAEKGFLIEECDKDGNCLFRAVAHQIYNDANRHEAVRKACYDYMERDRDHFSQYVDGDFGEYLARQRQASQWGDHLEIVAMKEMYNKNVEIYDKDCVKGATSAPLCFGLISCSQLQSRWVLMPR